MLTATQRPSVRLVLETGEEEEEEGDNGAENVRLFIDPKHPKGREEEAGRSERMPRGVVHSYAASLLNRPQRKNRSVLYAA